MTILELLDEPIITKNKWQKIDPSKYVENLIELGKIAYKKSKRGSFINSKNDMVGSTWLGINIDEDSLIDATIFYRGPRPTETWKGLKIQGVGHDGSREAKIALIKKLKQLLKNKRFWIEASGALEHVLYRVNVPYITDKKLVKKIFPNSKVKFIGDRGKYIRTLNSKEKIKDTIFGNITV